MGGWAVEADRRSTHQEPSAYLVRVQVQIGGRLHTDADSLSCTALGRPVSMKSRSGPLSKTDWIVLESRGFSSEPEARRFGERLWLLAAIAGLCSRLGLDAGRDTNRGEFSEHALRRMNLDPGFTDNSASFDANEYPDSLINSLSLLNLAMIASDRRAKIVLAIAAVEGLIRDTRWSDGQKRWFTETIANLRAEDDDELSEIAEALDSQHRHRISLRQGVFRLLSENGLGDYRSRWDDLYNRRSRFVRRSSWRYFRRRGVVLPSTGG